MKSRKIAFVGTLLAMCAFTHAQIAGATYLRRQSAAQCWYNFSTALSAGEYYGQTGGGTLLCPVSDDSHLLRRSITTLDVYTVDNDASHEATAAACLNDSASLTTFCGTTQHSGVGSTGPITLSLAGALPTQWTNATYDGYFAYISVALGSNTVNLNGYNSN